MQAGFDALIDLVRKPYRTEGGVKTDRSVLLVYTPERELEFREQLRDHFLPRLEAEGHVHRALDVTGFLFEGLDQQTIGNLCEDEFDDYQWMKQGLASRIELSLTQRITSLAAQIPGGTVIVYATLALYPLIRFGELLRGLRDLDCRILLAFPGAERGGKLYFLNQSDGGNYLAVKLMM